MFDWLRDYFLLNPALVSSILLIASVLLLRVTVVRRLRVTSATAEMRRRWIVQVRQASLFLIALGLLYIWEAELRAFGLSVFAITAAIEANPALVSSILLIAAVLLLRVTVVRRLRVTSATAEMRRRWIVQVRQASLFLIALGLLYIWGAELRAFALSVFAITAAIVIATKELIMCASGAVLKSTSRAFAIGDRIEVNEIRGDVFDHTLLSTTLLEIGPGKATHQHTGRTIVIPNSLFLSSPVVNETFTDDYVLHLFSIPIKPADDWRRAEQLLLRLATEESASYIEDARSHMEKIGEAQGIKSLSVEPRVTIQIVEPEKLLLIVRIPVEARRKGRIEQAIIHKFMEAFFPPEQPNLGGVAAELREAERKE